MNLKEEKKTSLILTTHYMEEAEQLCDRIIIDKGKILARGSLDELLNKCGANEIIEISWEGDNDVDLTGISGILKSNKMESKYILEVDKIVETLPLLLQLGEKQNRRIDSLECRTVTLDDLFISMTGRRLKD